MVRAETTNTRIVGIEFNTQLYSRCYWNSTLYVGKGAYGSNCTTVSELLPFDGKIKIYTAI